jgi:DNA-binding NarL/FixJ family response regulator
MKTMAIVADSSFVIETIRLALRNTAGLKLLGKVDGRTDVRGPIGHAQPDVILVDEMQNAGDALERIRECRDETPDSSILLLTMRMEDDAVARAIDAGVDACVSKTTHLPSLGTLIHEIVERNIVCAMPRAVREGTVGFTEDDLTAREREVLQLVADGLTNSQIAGELWVTEQTVKFHLSNVYRKLGVSNRTQASRYAHVHGLMRRPGPRLIEPAEPDKNAPPLSKLTPLQAAGAA